MMILLFAQVKKVSRSQVLSQQKWRELSQCTAAHQQTQKLLDTKQKELDSYKAEVYKSLQGQGRFEPELLNELIAACKQEVTALSAQVEHIQADLADLNNESTRLQKDYDGQSGYGVTKLDELIDNMMILLFAQVKKVSRSQVLSQQRWRELSQCTAAHQQVQKLLDTKQKELDSYKAEVYKSLQGQGRFEPELLNELIAACKQEVTALTAQVEHIQADLADLNSESTRLQKDYDTMISWASIYVTASKEQKKMILHQLIHKVIVGRDYKIDVQFNLTYQQYQELFFGGVLAPDGDADAPEILAKRLG